MSRLDAWLDERIQPPARPAVSRPVLVLCRSNATVHAVRGWLARRGGLAGIDVATPASLASALSGPWLGERPPHEEDLPDTPFARRIRERPGLVALARMRVRQYRLNRLASPDLPAPAWLAELAAGPWADDAHDERRLLELAGAPRSRRDGVALTASLRWARVVSIGFEAPLEPWTRAVHDHLAGPVPDRGPRASLGPAHGVPDTAAEARLAAHLAGQDPGDTLVLVQHDATAARVHRALLRAGIPSSWRPAARLERHTLASVIRRCVPWFSGASDPPVRAVDLHAVLRHPMVLGRLPPPAQEWLKRELAAIGEDPARTSLSARGVAKAIRRARHLDAPLGRWMEAVAALGGRQDEPRVAARALRLLARLKVLDACVRGVPFQSAFDVDAPEEEADWGDFDALIADLLGDQDPAAPPEAAAPGTLGALRRFLLACRVRTHEDPASLRILGMLRRGKDRPATRLEAVQLLQGTADRGEVRPGVQIVPYEDWDGRPCATLILTDLHDQGVAGRPSPDPLLSDAWLERLGQLDGRAKVRFRLTQLERAAARAERVHPLVTARDAMGRAVVAPVQLALDVKPWPTGPYGLMLAGPEAPQLTALRARAATPDPPRTPDPDADRLAGQVTAEWVRSARGPIGAPPKYGRYVDHPTLGHHLLRRPEPPAWLTPWLGAAGEAPEAHLDPAPERSATRFFQPLAHCMYQAFARVQLRLEEPESVSEELDPREIGQAAHAALEAVALRGAWAHDAEDGRAVAEAFARDLQAATGPAFEAARARFGALSAARRLATDGLEQRWKAHWSLYAHSRARRTPRSPFPERPAAEALVHSHRLTDAAVDALLQRARQAGLDGASPFWVRKWAVSAADHAAGGGGFPTDDDLLRPGGGPGLQGPWAPLLRDFVAERAFRDLVALWRDARELAEAYHAPTVATVAELPFGAPGDPPRSARAGTLQRDEPVAVGPVKVSFGGRELALTGSIDRVSAVGSAERPLLRVVDYKSGTAAPTDKEAVERIRRLVEPQLVIYALVLREALRSGALPPFAGGRVATVGWDFLRATDDQRKLEPARDVLLDDHTLTGLARALGELVDRAAEGVWPLSPRPDTCPELGAFKHDHCPFAGACRLRAVPPSALSPAEET